MTNGRAKGNKFENDVCRAISEWLAPRHTLPNPKVYELPFRRRSTSIMPLDGHWHGEGDLLHKPLPGIVSPFCFECKKVEGWELDGAMYVEGWKVWSWWEQCLDQAEKVSLAPLLIFNRNRRPILIMVRESEQSCLKMQPKHGPVLHVQRPAGQNVVVARLDDLVRVPLARVKALSKALS